MAIIKKKNSNMFTGLIGPMIMATWKGILYARARPRKSAVKKEGTPGQVAARGKFRYLHQFLSPFHPFITVGFSGKAVNKTEINVAFTANYHSAVMGVYPDLSMDYQRIRISEGKLEGLIAPELSCSPSGLVEINWKTEATRRGGYNDHLMLVLYSELYKKTDGFIGHAQRSDHYCSFPIREEMQKGRVHVYVSFASQNRRLASNSQYLGVLEF